MKHKYMIHEGQWDLKGSYVGPLGSRHDAVGKTLFTHAPHEWISSGELRILGDEPVSLPHQYSIVPMIEGTDLTTWHSVHTTEGLVRGTIAIVADSQISTFRSDTTDYYGVDVTRKVKEDTYQSRGFIVRGGVKLSSWVLNATRAQPAKPAKSGKSAKLTKKAKA